MNKEEMKEEMKPLMTEEEKAEHNRLFRREAALALKGSDFDLFKGIRNLSYEDIYGEIKPEKKRVSKKLIYEELVKLSSISYESWKFSRDEVIKDRDFWKARCIELEKRLGEGK